MRAKEKQPNQSWKFSLYRLHFCCKINAYGIFILHSSFVGHLLDDGRLDHHGLQGGQMTPIYGASGALRAASNSNSPGNLHGQPSTLLVVPQPINATKMSSGLTNGSGRKYQCKMCPQVSSDWQKRSFSVRLPPSQWIFMTARKKSQRFAEKKKIINFPSVLSNPIQKIIMSQRKKKTLWITKKKRRKSEYFIKGMNLINFK